MIELIFSGQDVLVNTKNKSDLLSSPVQLHSEPESVLVIEDPEGIEYRGSFFSRPIDPPEGHTFIHFRELARTIGTDRFTAAGRLYQLLYWDASHRFCGRCGAEMGPPKQEYSKTCEACELQIFPQIAPAIIIAVLKEKKLLLARNSRFPEGLYSLVAGFMEPGETIEECAVREVKEETGIEIGNIRYFGSQPWPFPHSLMIGLIGDYAGGDLLPDGVEITDARWFTPDDLPKLPGPGSISRKLIDWYVEHGAWS